MPAQVHHYESLDDDHWRCDAKLIGVVWMVLSDDDDDDEDDDDDDDDHWGWDAKLIGGGVNGLIRATEEGEGAAATASQSSKPFLVMSNFWWENNSHRVLIYARYPKQPTIQEQITM